AHAVVASQRDFVGNGVVGAGVGLLGLEQGGRERQAVIQEVPFGAQFPTAAFFRLQVADGGAAGGAVRAAGLAQVFARGVGRGGIRQVDGAIAGRFVDQAQLIVEEGVGARVLRIVDLEIIVPDAQVDRELLIDVYGVQQVDGIRPDVPVFFL